jgi:hypothetical protein
MVSFNADKVIAPKPIILYLVALFGVLAAIVLIPV